MPSDANREAGERANILARTVLRLIHAEFPLGSHQRLVLSVVNTTSFVVTKWRNTFHKVPSI
jgi:hypothetical protein